MPRPGKTKDLFDFDPNKSDPEDEDFDIRNQASSPRPRKHRNKSRPSQHRTPQKKRRGGRDYDTSGDDIVDDDEEISEEAFTESSEEDEEEVETNSRTGRRIRGAAKKQITYEESDASNEDAFIENSDGSDEDQKDEISITPKKTRGGTQRSLHQTLLKPSKVVRLQFGQWEKLSSDAQPEGENSNIKQEIKMARARSTRSRTASRPPTAAPSNVGTRKSSRLSREPEAMVALSSSGRHAIPASSSPAGDDGDDEPISGRRRTVGSKGPRQQPSRKMPSTVMEQSQEGTQADDAEGEAEEEMIMQPEELPHDVVDSVEIHAEVTEVVEEVEGGEAAELMEEDAPLPAIEVEEIEEQAEAESDDDGPVGRRRTLRQRNKPANQSPAKRKRGVDESSEFDPEEANADDDNMSEEDDGRRHSKRLRAASSSQSNNGARRGRTRGARSRQESSDGEGSEDLDADELLEEAQDLKRAPKNERRTRQSQAFPTDGISFDGRARRTTKHVDYSIRPLEDIYAQDALNAAQSDAGEASQAGKGRKKKRKPRDQRLHSVRGIFGGWGTGPALLTSQLDDIALMGADPESSDDEDVDAPQTALLKTPAPQDAAGGPADFGKVNKEKKLAGADTDPLGVDENVKFDKVGGLDDHINALKEMVLHPLMYPEVIGKFGVQPPRGVLFHGPPGTGKTLLARALSNSMELSSGRKVTFFMRKGADALSKWVGEAERQLRLLFEEAQKCQPSIIFFDEIDGLAPTRSSKTEQIHASIVATLLALMDGMDNRGQVVVIGATNRPDNVDPALRRPGRFDREFYFPLPDKKARMSIIDINTKDWTPALSPQLKDNLAELTVGYGGADLRALCTEAALNAIQGTYPQIYKSNKKLLVDPAKIKVLAKDFMISVNKITPSSARSQTGKVEPLPKSVEPLLRDQLEKLAKVVDEILPRRKKLTALEEAEFDDRDEDPTGGGGFERDMLQREVDKAKIFRPRLLVHGLRGMGQQELSSALLHKLEGLFVQSFDMATLMEDSSRSPEAAVVQLFKEVKRQKPSVIFVPDVDIWYQTVGDNVLKIFLQQLRAIPANDPVLLLGVMGSETIEARPDPAMLRDLFGFSKRSEFRLERPGKEARFEYWTSLITLIRKRPTEFPDPNNRKKRRLEVLQEVKPTAMEVRAQDKQKRKQQYREERNALNLLKMSIGVVFEQIKKKYGILRNAQIPMVSYKYLFDDAAEGVVTSDLTEEQRQQLQERPFVLDKDKHGRGVLREVATGKVYYNMDIEDIEERLANGYYRRWKDFLADVRTIMHDAMTVDASLCPDPEKQDERRRKTQELVNNVEVDLESFRREKRDLDVQLASMYARVVEDYKDKKAKGLPLNPLEGGHPIGTTTNMAPIIGRPPQPGELRRMDPPPAPFTPLRNPSAHTNGESAGALTNGTSKDHDGDVTMEETPGHPVPGKQLRQGSALEKMAPHSQVDDYRNSGTTTTGQTNSNRTSGAGQQPPPATAPAALQQSSLGYSAHTPAGFPPGYNHLAGANQAAVGAVAPPQQGGVSSALEPAAVNSQGQLVNSQGEVLYNSQGEPLYNSNGTESRHYPNWMSAGDLDGGSQYIPDTQPGTEHSNSLRSGGSSTQRDPRSTAAVANLLNKPIPEEEVETHPPFEPREEMVKQLHEMLAERTSGFSVEQMVQTMAELVNEVIRNSQGWDKRIIVEAVGRAFEESKRDIEEMQVVMEGSYGA